MSKTKTRLVADFLGRIRANTDTGVAEQSDLVDILGAAPEALDTINKLAAAIGDDASFATTVSDSIATKVAKAGDTMTGNLYFGNNDRAFFGTNNNLEIWSDGSSSQIRENGAGNFAISGSDIYIRSASGLKTMATFIDGGAASIFYDNAAVLATTSTGVDVTGTITADGLTVGGASNLAASISNITDTAAYHGLKINTASTSSITYPLYVRSNNLDRFVVQGNGDISFYDSSGSSQSFFWDASAESLGITNSAPSSALVITKGNTTGNALEISNSGESRSLDINHNADGTGTVDDIVRIKNNGTSVFEIDSSGNVGIGTSSPSSNVDILGTSSRVRLDGSAASFQILSRNTADSATNPLTFDADTYTFNRAGSTQAVIDSSGNVGIGTPSPTAPLTVNGRGADFGRRAAGGSAESRYLMIEGTADLSGEGSGRIMFTEHNATSVSADDYGFSIHYNGVGTSTTFPSGFSPDTTNAQWQFRGHNGSLEGLPIITGSRSWQGITIHGGTTVNEDSLDQDFRVESDGNSHALFVNAGTNKVGILNSDPQTELDIGGNLRAHNFQKKWDAVISPTSWSRVCKHSGGGVTGGSYTLQLKGTRGNVVFSLTALVTYGHSASASITVVGGVAYTGWKLRAIVDVYGTGWIEMQDTGSLTYYNASDGQTVYCSATTTDPQTTIEAVTTLTDGSTIPSGYYLRSYIDGIDKPTLATESFTVRPNAVIVNETGEDREFRVESNGQSHMLFVDAGGDKILVGKSASDFSSGGVELAKAINSDGWAAYFTSNHTSTSGGTVAVNRRDFDGDIIRLHRQSSTVGAISVNSSGTTYSTTSDRRLKDNIQPIADATDKLMAMNPVSHTWIADPEAPAVNGFIAQEMQEIVPEAVSGEPDGEEMMSMDYGRITPVLVAALQDAHKKIAELEARLNTYTLEGK